ncbi:MAG TPA: SemiSWEET family transporter [Desulfitobacteriaceae bacterium]|nr:SemiSWEET family transporter [Desulfitobacteriaceae bacterium]
MITNIFGVIAGVLGSIRLIPQVYKSLRTKHTRDLSAAFLIIVFFQSLFLVFYGIAKPDVFILYGNFVPLICSMILLYLKWKYRR